MTNDSVVIAVWGTPGSGKSTFSAILARYLSRDKSKSIIISPDIHTPMLPVWFPSENIENSMSIGHILNSHEINSGIIAGKVKLLKSYPYVGVLGYTSGDMPLSYPEVSYEKIAQLIQVTAGMVDYVIVDCTSRVTDLFTPAAIEAADVIVGIFSADLRGVSYRKAQLPLLNGQKFRLEDHLIIAGMVRPYYALDEMEHICGGLDGVLPWVREIDRGVTEGVAFNNLKYCPDKYLDVLDSILDRCKHKGSGYHESEYGGGGGIIYDGSEESE